MTATRKWRRAAARASSADMPRRVRRLLLPHLTKQGAAGRRSPWRFADGTRRRVPKFDNGPRHRNVKRNT